jgi:hypothetical protein
MYLPGFDPERPREKTRKFDLSYFSWFSVQKKRVAGRPSDRRNENGDKRAFACYGQIMDAARTLEAINDGPLLK